MPRIDLNPAPAITEVTFLLDRSGSMSANQDSTIEAFNAYLATLKEAQTEISFSLLLFDHDGSKACVERVCVSLPIRLVRPLTLATYIPRGGTPLVECVFDTISAVERRIHAMPLKPKVVICVQTDGEENQSGPEYSFKRLKTLISAKQEQGWEFLFMGAGIDAYNQGARMGVSVGNTVSYNSTDRAATQSAFRGTATNTASFASGQSVSTSYSPQQKAAAGDQFDPAKASLPKQPSATPTSAAEGDSGLNVGS